MIIDYNKVIENQIQKHLNLLINSKQYQKYLEIRILNKGEKKKLIDIGLEVRKDVSE